MSQEQEIAKVLEELHNSYLKGNQYDEGDLIFYRINYRLADMFGFSKEEARRYHDEYHEQKLRHISEAFCDSCKKIVKIVPIIYGAQQSDIEILRAAEKEGRLIIGDAGNVKEGTGTAMFGCRVCRRPFEYGTI